MNGIDAFQESLKRSRYFVSLYELLENQRQRRARASWLNDFKELMRWPSEEEINRVDGNNCILILRESSDLTQDEFTHEHLSELLRAAWAGSISAMDRYFHDIITYHCWKLLSRPEEGAPKTLKGIAIPAWEAKKALEKIRRDPASRPGTIVKAAIQKELHKITFQSPNEIDKAISMLGVNSNFWNNVAAKMSDGSDGGEVKKRLGELVHRRNQIVHEADKIIRQRGASKLRDISMHDTTVTIDWIEDFVKSVDALVDDQLW